jgi:hypothetical protein
MAEPLIDATARAVRDAAVGPQLPGELCERDGARPEQVGDSGIRDPGAGGPDLREERRVDRPGRSPDVRGGQDETGLDAQSTPVGSPLLPSTKNRRKPSGPAPRRDAAEVGLWCHVELP